MNRNKLDPREHAFRPTIAASYLKGLVTADCFSDGVLYRVTTNVLALKNKPAEEAELATELLFGETFIVYENLGQWAWGQSQTDGYVGFAKFNGLSKDVIRATHEVGVLKTFVYKEPDIKSPVLRCLVMGSRVSIKEENENFLGLKDAGWIVGRHLADNNNKELDFISVARKYIGTPYLWGGRSSYGLDCSALVQISLSRIGILTPRDTDQQERNTGTFCGRDVQEANEGDLLYTKGHVAIVSTVNSVIHANAYHMQVVEEPLKVFISRIDANNDQITSIKRLNFPSDV